MVDRPSQNKNWAVFFAFMVNLSKNLLFLLIIGIDGAKMPVNVQLDVSRGFLLRERKGAEFRWPANTA
jgi:NAD/NADP transhydrogenase beta subunit